MNMKVHMQKVQSLLPRLCHSARRARVARMVARFNFVSNPSYVVYIYGSTHYTYVSVFIKFEKKLRFAYGFN